MAQVEFTAQLKRFTATPTVDAPTATTLREALDAAFALNPRLRGYVLDDQGHLRTNVMVYVDGVVSCDRSRLRDPLRPDSRIHVMQALSGG